jgi:hypothetical protein
MSSPSNVDVPSITWEDVLNEGKVLEMFFDMKCSEEYINEEDIKNTKTMVQIFGLVVVGCYMAHMAWLNF